jgi:hypothetical protein
VGRPVIGEGKPSRRRRAVSELHCLASLFFPHATRVRFSVEKRPSLRASCQISCHVRRDATRRAKHKVVVGDNETPWYRHPIPSDPNTDFSIHNPLARENPIVGMCSTYVFPNRKSHLNKEATSHRKLAHSTPLPLSAFRADLLSPQSLQSSILHPSDPASADYHANDRQIAHHVFSYHSATQCNTVQLCGFMQYLHFTPRLVSAH